MTSMHAKLLIAGLIIAAAASYLSFAGMRSGWVYYLEVDQFLTGVDYQAQRVRLCGLVGEDQLQVKPAQLTASFLLLGSDDNLPVVYRGVIPDRFEAGSEVVVEGQLDEAGVFQADIMLTKCASKYQAEDHAERLEKNS